MLLCHVWASKKPKFLPTAAKEEDRREADDPQQFLLDPADQGTLWVRDLATQSGQAENLTGFKHILRRPGYTRGAPRR